MRKHLFFLLLAAGVALAFLSSCASEPPVISEDVSAAELIQRAQEASDRSDWETAILYYETARARFGTDSTVLVACEYETAFIHYKQNLFALAEEEFTALIAKYESSEGSSLPPSYLILARKVLPKVQEKRSKAEAKAKVAPEPAAEPTP
jgi:outer membrane protein assembly factor BamD (BamD/ComL family)